MQDTQQPLKRSRVGVSAGRIGTGSFGTFGTMWHARWRILFPRRRSLTVLSLRESIAEDGVVPNFDGSQPVPSNHIIMSIMMWGWCLPDE